MSVLEKTKDLCLALKESSEMKNFLAAKEELLNSPEDKDRLERYLSSMAKASEAEREGKSLSPEEKLDLERTSKMVAFYPITSRYLGTQQAYLKLVKQVSTMLNAAMENKEIPDCSSNGKTQCTGSCSDCGQ